MLSFKNEFEREDSYQQTVNEELFAPLPWEFPRLTLSDYKTFIKHHSDDTYITDILSNMEYRCLHWLHAYGIEIFLKQDLFFHQILFLLAFVPDTKLDEYINFTPSHSLTISNTKIARYYEDIQRIISLPTIDCFLHFENADKHFMIINITNLISLSNYPCWLLFTMYHLSNKQLQAAKNLYITLVLRKRYHKQKDNDSFPNEILDLLQGDISIVDDLYAYCNQ